MEKEKTPTCPFCGKEIAKPIYNEKNIIINWKYEKHICDEKIKWIKENPFNFTLK